MSILTDAFSRADTGAGAGLGTAPSGLVWSQISGSWQLISNRAYTPTAAAANPVATVASTANVDVSVSVSPTGGDALYLRVEDANNWYRLRVENNTRTVVTGQHQESYQTGTGQYTWTWNVYSETVYGQWLRGPYSNTFSSPWPGNDTYSNGYPCNVGSSYEVMTTAYYTADTTAVITDHKVLFEKCVAGVVTLLATYVVTNPTTSLRAVAFGSDYKVFINGTASPVGVITDSALSTATKHGLGRGGVNTYNSGSALDNFSVTDIVAPPATTVLTPASGSTISTGRPSVGLMLNLPSSGQRIKGQWQFATDSGFTTDVILVTESDSDLRAITGTTTEVLTNATRLTKDNCIWYLRGRAIDEYGSAGPWTSSNSITVNIPAPISPTDITPVDLQILNTDTLVLQGNAPAPSDGQKVKIEWQFATNAAFSANIKNITEPDSALRYSGSSSYIIPNIDHLSQNTWYYRARVIDQYGQASTYSNTTIFTITHPPGVSECSPSGSVNLIYTAFNLFSWIFNDTSPTDTQTAYQIIIERNDTGVTVSDTGKVVSTVSAATLAIAVGYKDIQLRWKIRVWDTGDVVGIYTPYNLFKVSDTPVVTITSLTDGGTTNSARPIIDWTFTAGGGRTQASYRVTFKKVGQPDFALDSGLVIGQAISFNPIILLIKNGEVYTITVSIVDSSGLTASNTVTVTAVYTPPATVVFTASSIDFAATGHVQINWLNFIYDSGFLRWRIYRRVQGTTTWELIDEIVQNGINEYSDWSVPANQSYEYNVTQVADRFGQEIESLSPIVTTKVVVAGGDYWIIDPIDPNNNCKLSLVKDDGYTDMYEMAEYTIVGRGRHVDYGESIGKSGSLTAQLRDTLSSSARTKKQSIESLKRKRIPVILRTPFGDVYNVSLGEVAVSRIAGTGTSEFCDITVPYLEIF